jgi:hypothetical protein
MGISPTISDLFKIYATTSHKFDSLHRIYGILLIARYKPETFVRQLLHELSKIVLILLQNG